MSSHFAKSVAACMLAMAIAGARLAGAQDNPPPRSPAVKPSPKLPLGTTTTWSPPTDYLMVPGFWSLGLKSVQKEVGLTAEQKAKLKEISDAYQSAVRRSFGQLENLPPQEQEKKLAEVREEAGQMIQSTRKKAAAVLTPGQAAAVRKIDFQLRAASYLAAPNFQDELGLTDDQRLRLRQIFDESQEKVQQVQRETGTRALDVLTPQQAEQFLEQLEKSQPGTPR
ncbi:MAG: hypothetical protein ABR915_20435 [Thermoguttaceae bacterium]|jgi:Spy/CpxP family protein refolding chaperone